MGGDRMKWLFILALCVIGAAHAQAATTWYYCDGQNGQRGWYPYVQNCPQGWRQVAAPTSATHSASAATSPPSEGSSDPCSNPNAPIWQPSPWAASIPAIGQAASQNQQQMRDQCRFMAQQKQNEAIQQQAAQERQRQYSQEVTQQTRSDEQRGYRRVGFEDFILDAAKLADGGEKISVQGVYVRVGDNEVLVQSMSSAYSLSRSDDTGEIIPLLTDNATRNLRKYFLECRNRSALGCQVTVLGHATTCRKRTLVGASDVYCFDVEDGWNFAQ
jgi:hypothetical protein